MSDLLLDGGQPGRHPAYWSSGTGRACIISGFQPCRLEAAPVAGLSRSLIPYRSNPG